MSGLQSALIGSEPVGRSARRPLNLASEGGSELMAETESATPG